MTVAAGCLGIEGGEKAGGTGHERNHRTELSGKHHGVSTQRSS
jgi:hypothetical protein